MNELKRISGITELFYTIDIVDNSISENDLIIERVKEKLNLKCKYEYKRKRKMKAQKEMLKNYIVYLEEFNRIITEQLDKVGNMVNDLENRDIYNDFVQMQEQIDSYSRKKDKIKASYLARLLEPKEQEIYKDIELYRIINEFNEDSKIDNANYIDLEINEDKDNTESMRWKMYYYLALCMEKQNAFRRSTFSDYIRRQDDMDDIQYSIKKNSFYAADFQGQLSNCVYQRRKKLKLTQAELSRRSGVDRSMIAKIERANQPTTLDTAVKLLSALDINVAICPDNYQIKENKIAVS